MSRCTQKTILDTTKIGGGANYLAHYGVKGMKWHKHTKKDETANQYIQGAREMAKENRDYHKQFREIRTQKRYEPLKKKLQSSERTKYVVDPHYYVRSKRSDASWARKLRKQGKKNTRKSIVSKVLGKFGR